MLKMKKALRCGKGLDTHQDRVDERITVGTSKPIAEAYNVSKRITGRFAICPLPTLS
jgi:hypothetical protein